MTMNLSPKKIGKSETDSSTETTDSSPRKVASLGPLICCLVLLWLLWFPINIVLSLSTANGSQVKASITDLYAPIITYNSARNFLSIPSIFFALSLYGDTSELDIYYDNITLKFYYVGSINTTNIAKYTWPGFYQAGDGHGTYAQHYDHVKARGIYLDEFAKSESEIVLRVNLETAVRFQSLGWKSEKHKLLVRSDVRLSTTTGKKVEIGSLELRPYTKHGSGGHYGTAMTFSHSYVFFMFVMFLYFVAVGERIDGTNDSKLSAKTAEDHEVALK